MKKWTSLFLFAGLMIGSVAHAMNLDILSLTDVVTAQENSDGTYDVICANGNHEKVTAVDIRLGNVCPNDKNSVPTGVLSFQKRSDGQFDVVCRDLTKIVATELQILNNEACVNSAPEVIIEDGVYSASGGSDCTIKAVYTGRTMTGLHAEFPGTSSDMTCTGNICSGKFANYPQTYTFKILSQTSFEYSYDNHQGAMVFNKKK